MSAALATAPEGFWTGERVETLVLMYQAGKSGAQIAAAIGDGCTRNAVIGKVSRLRLKRRWELQPRVADPPLPKPPSAAAKPKPEPPPVAVVPPPRPAPTCERVDLLELRDHHCRYPFGDGPYRFCGRPKVEGYDPPSPYCPEHHEIAYVPAPGRRLARRVS